ncbi:hypothetical protein Tco_0336063 [Tanacetum coccineum]
MEEYRNSTFYGYPTLMIIGLASHRATIDAMARTVNFGNVRQPEFVLSCLQIRMAPVEIEELKEQLKEMLRMAILDTSVFHRGVATTFLFVKKKGETWGKGMR